jgi:hypothetical protein
MTQLRRPLIAVLAATAALAVGAPAASAAPAFGSFPLGTPIDAVSFPGPASACPTNDAYGQGPTGGVDVHSCGLAFIGPISQISTVMGPTIITASFVGTSIVSAGSVAITP